MTNGCPEECLPAPLSKSKYSPPPGRYSLQVVQYRGVGFRGGSAGIFKCGRLFSSSKCLLETTKLLSRRSSASSLLRFSKALALAINSRYVGGGGLRVEEVVEHEQNEDVTRLRRRSKNLMLRGGCASLGSSALSTVMECTLTHTSTGYSPGPSTPPRKCRSP
jgi:hypothetical protein